MVDSITWTHDQFPVYANNTRNISMDNATLTFDPVMRSDNGNYQCVASNPLSNLTSEIFILNVFCEYSMPILRCRTHFCNWRCSWYAEEIAINQNQNNVIVTSNTAVVNI